MRILILCLGLALLNPTLTPSSISTFDDQQPLRCNDDVTCYEAVNSLDVDEDEQIEILSDMYEDIPDKELAEFEEMEVEDVKDEIDSFEDKYEIGEPFSEEDQALLLYAYNEYGGAELDSGNYEGNDSDIPLENVSYAWRTYSIGSNKSKLGVKTTYSGKLKTYVTASGGKYYTDVKVNVKSGKSKIKSLKWKTYHSAYGLLGTNGSSPSLGIVYNGSVSSSKYKSTFSFENTKNYTSALPVYVKTWGKVFVKTNKGEYNYGTSVKSSWE